MVTVQVPQELLARPVDGPPEMALSCEAFASRRRKQLRESRSEPLSFKTGSLSSDSLMSQDVIRIGPYDLVFTRTQLIQQSSSRSIRIDALNLIQYRDKQKILLNVISPFPQTVLLPPPLEIYISLSLTSLVGLMIGLMISCLAANSDQANSIIPVILNIPNPFLRRDLQADRLWGGTRRILRDALVDDRYGIVGWFGRFPGGV